MVRNWSVGLAVAALVLCLSVFFVNGRSLIYFDTASYMAQGDQLLELVGLKSPEAAATNTVTAEGTDSGAADTTVVGSRSIAYGIFIAILVSAFGLGGVVVANVAVFVYASYITAALMAPKRSDAIALTAWGILAASLGSLPFYLAFAMPDILAPVLVLLVATLSAYSDRMTLTEKVASLAISMFCVVAHPSHLILVALLIPVAVFASPRLAGRRVALMAVLLGVLLCAGLAERFAFGLAADRLLHKRVLYLPFITTRLIADGPGYSLLAQKCPDPTYPTCTLYEALQRSSNPDRLFGPNILFSSDSDLGSFRLLDDASRSAIAAHQFAFTRDVVAAYPLQVMRSIATNTLLQLGLFSVDMTIPTQDMLTTTERAWPSFPKGAFEGRLVGGGPDWLGPLTVFHGIVYSAGAVILGWLLVSGRLTRRVSALVMVSLAGIVLNAFVCGAISEPASRYGARVMFLIPMLAAMSLWVSRRGSEDRTADR